MSSTPTTSKNKSDNYDSDGPDVERFLYPWDTRSLVGYLRAVREHFGYAKFLGLPKIKDEPDIPLSSLYVGPTVSPTYISPDLSPEKWPTNRVSTLQALLDANRLMLLGDPGSGKSTLVSWICCQLSEPMGSIWSKHLNNSVPFPFIVRDLKISEEITWDTLLDAFLAQSPGASLAEHRDVVEELLQRGQGLILVDGLDEIGSAAVLISLRNALFNGFSRYPACRWIITSRIVGHDRVNFHDIDMIAPNIPESTKQAASRLSNRLSLQISKEFKVSASGTSVFSDDEAIKTTIRIFEPKYLAPFDDTQIEEFAQNWWASREKSEATGEGEAGDLVTAVQSHPSTRRLARIPNLLTMMALIHRTRAQLPHGRANLYEEISQAYLHTIDAFRNLDDTEYSYEDKRYWLAKVGFEMQLQRSQGGNEQEILATKQAVVDWVVTAMDEYGDDRDDAKADARLFVDHVARRSGLLIPKSEAFFSFVHLSFQEYFAAVYLSEQVQGGLLPDWKQCASDTVFPVSELTPSSFAAFAREEKWKESLILFFESLPKARRTPDKVAKGLFGTENFQPFDLDSLPNMQAHRSDVALVALLAGVATDPYSNLSMEVRRFAWNACWEWALTQQNSESLENLDISETPVLSNLLHTHDDNLWQALESVWSDGQYRRFVLPYQAPSPRNLDVIVRLNGLEELWLCNNREVEDLSPLGSITGLQTLCLVAIERITDLTPLCTLTNLETLSLVDCEGVPDLTPLCKLTRLIALQLVNVNKETDLSPLSALTELRILQLVKVDYATKLSFLKSLKRLRVLQLIGISGVLDLSSLSELTDLHSLSLAGSSGITDISALSTLTALEELDLVGCTALAEIPKALRERPDLRIKLPEHLATKTSNAP